MPVAVRAETGFLSTPTTLLVYMARGTKKDIPHDIKNLVVHLVVGKASRVRPTPLIQTTAAAHTAQCEFAFTMCMRLRVHNVRHPKEWPEAHFACRAKRNRELACTHDQCPRHVLF
ncbi:hypothetical protein C8R44DRAFT_864682 [Mycena epipterygia]|nr:hypothetical protein C8R44DRAFT_864682 [Mycena epipterygia]